MEQQQHFQAIYDIIRESEDQGLFVEPRGLSGFSGAKLVGMLQRLARYEASRNGGLYLEVGVFQGLTLISTACALDGGEAFGIDNFAQFDASKKNQAIIQKRMEANEVNNANLINRDYEDALEDLKAIRGEKKIGVFFVDGPHDYRSQAICLHLIKPHLSESAVIVIDDCNYRHVRLANRDFLVSNPEFKLIFESYTRCHPGNMTKEEENEARRGWWNGVNVIVKDPENRLEGMYPETLRDRRLYENEHVVHSEKYGCLAIEAVKFVASVMSWRFIKAAKQFTDIIRKARCADNRFVGDYTSMNTFSGELPQCHFNPSVK